MRLFLDTEFNGFGGELLSIALVPENDSFEEFYYELETDVDLLVPWVREHVIPSMDQDAVSVSSMQKYLSKYLWQFNEVEIIVDWPDDIKYFCEALITGPGERIGIPDTVKFTLNCLLGSSASEVLHHALHDARAIKQDYFELEKIKSTIEEKIQ